MTPSHLAVKNFERFQHYRDRNPPWIKLYGDVLVNLEFLLLPEAAQAQLVKLWILASQIGNPLPNDPKFLAGKIGTKKRFYLPEMIASGFLIPCEQNASGVLAKPEDFASAPLADCKQNAIPSVRGRFQSSELELEATTAATASGDFLNVSPIALTVWANRAITEHWTEQPAPLTPSGAVELSEVLVSAGVEPDVARLSIYRQCRESRKDRPPRGVNYFRPGIEDDWQAVLARRAVKDSGEVPPPVTPVNGNGAHSPSRQSSQGAAALAFGQIRELVRESRQPGQATLRYIPRQQVAELGADVLQAYDAIGGAERVLSATGAQIGFVIRDFTQALEAL